ncbi:hypothetical protein M0R45_015957 [Rubus argutus]|uniref:HAT C-terminal dimerisation domain-containing protein n=1 Tax=Rubus argutus TaxID=59490 RepID=A0AAW1XTK6_RUBAR
MGYIYELMDDAKEKIAFNLHKNPRHYQPIWNKIDARWTPQLHHPLHEAGKIMSPASWWERFGEQTPELTKFAIRVLSLTCSASGCERNWSTFQSIHKKKKNRLEHKRLNALVYVKYNSLLRERNIKRNAKKLDPILVEEIDSDDEWIAEVDAPILPSDLS